jgi:phosphoadenosine phosphosulfate reductase
MENERELKELTDKLAGKPLSETLDIIAAEFSGRTVFTTSFGIEDQVITHYIFTRNLPISVVTLDTGRLFPQTYEVFSHTMIRYRKKIHVLYPESRDIETMVTQKGPYSFYESVENRKECCRLRKILPLNRALQGMECWISGIRADQSPDRKQMSWLEYDETKKLFKFSPLFDWTFDDVKQFVSDNNIPYNSLHDKGFVSIGCEPCTKAIRPGEDFRAGRWWWENSGSKECGLHVKEE